MWHKAVWVVHSTRLWLTREVLQVRRAKDYTTRGVPNIHPVIYKL